MAIGDGMGIFRREAGAAAPAGSSPALVPVFHGWRKAVNLAGIGLWLAALAYFWVWWFQPGHNPYAGTMAPRDLHSRLDHADPVLLHCIVCPRPAVRDRCARASGHAARRNGGDEGAVGTFPRSCAARSRAALAQRLPGRAVPLRCLAGRRGSVAGRRSPGAPSTACRSPAARAFPNTIARNGHGARAARKATLPIFYDHLRLQPIRLRRPVRRRPHPAARLPDPCPRAVH